VRRLLAGLVALGLVLACSATWILLTVERGNAKDRRDLSDLTRSSPLPREQLVVPEGVPADGSIAWLDGTGLGVAYDLQPSPASTTRRTPNCSACYVFPDTRPTGAKLDAWLGS
jgi:hypothetical protein